MSTESRLNEVLDSGQTVNVTFSNEKPYAEPDDLVQTQRGRLVSTNSHDVVQFQPEQGAPVPVPRSRILIIE